MTLYEYYAFNIFLNNLGTPLHLKGVAQRAGAVKNVSALVADVVPDGPRKGDGGRVGRVLHRALVVLRGISLLQSSRTGN